MVNHPLTGEKKKKTVVRDTERIGELQLLNIPQRGQFFSFILHPRSSRTLGEEQRGPNRVKCDFSSGVPLPRPDRHSQKIYLARLGLSAKRPSSFLALAGRAAVSRLEAVFSLEVQSRCDRRRGRVVACRFCGRALPSRHVRSSSSLLPFSAPFSSHLVSSRLVSSADTSRNRLPVGNSWDPR